MTEFFKRYTIFLTALAMGTTSLVLSSCGDTFSMKTDQEKVADEFEQPIPPKRWEPVIVEYTTWDWPRQPIVPTLLSSSDAVDSANQDYVKATRAAIKAYEAKDLAEAERLFKEALAQAEEAKLNKHDLENAQANVAGIYLKEKKFEDYERHLKTAVLGDATKTYKDIEMVKKDFTDIQAKDRNQLAQMLLSKGRVDDAIVVMRVTVRSAEKSLRGRRDPLSPPKAEDLAWAYLNLGKQFEQNSRPGAADWAFKRAIWLWSELSYLEKPPLADVIEEYVVFLNKNQRGQEAASMQKIMEAIRKPPSKGM